MKTVRLTKTVLNGMDASLMATDIRADDPKAGITLSLALSTVESYLEEAAVQQRRIVREQEALRKHTRQVQSRRRSAKDRPWPWRRRHTTNAFRSVHLYLTCWRMVGRHLELVSRISRFAEVKAALRPHRSSLKAYQEMRDHYEHFDERLPGQPGVRRLAVPTDLGNFFGYTLTFGGQKLDVGPESMALLRRIVSEVLIAFKLGALRAMSSANPEIIQGWFAPLGIKYIERYVRRQMKIGARGSGGR